MSIQLYVIIHHRGPAWQAGVPYMQQPNLGDHIGFMRSLQERGLMVLGGPFMGDDSADGTVGMAIIRVESQARAEAIAAQDPSINRGLIVPRVRAWRAAMGDALPPDGPDAATDPGR